MRRPLLLASVLLVFGCEGYVALPEVDSVAPQPAITPDAVAPIAEREPAGDFTQVVEVEDDAPLRLAQSPQHGAYLTTRDGTPLYMYVADVAGTRTSACLDDCARDWPPYDADALRVGIGIEPREAARFHRQDGAWQTTYKGFPLYLRASEAGSGTITGDGFAGRWFLARDYLTFLSQPVNFEPAGSAPQASGLFLTDGFGRTLYVCLDDAPSTDTAPPRTSCTGSCVATRPPLSIGASQRTTVLPSTIDPRDLRAFTRPDGAAQLTYRGWPLYYFAGDTHTGDTHGHNEKAWRAIDPRTFPADTSAAPSAETDVAK
jgi:predicted lipoprotein with Yx(FWY)xxD motif